MYGWSGQILKVDLSEKKSTAEDVSPFIESFIGGIGINVKIMFDEVGTEVAPFDPENRLCFGPGVLTGTPAPSSSRMKLVSMSSRGNLVSAGIGGFISAEIRYAGYDNLTIQGKADRPIYIYIHDDSVEFRDANHLWGKGTWETQQLIRDELTDRDVKVMCIGPGGENLVSFACVGTGNQLSFAGREGLGAIMGSKNLKAVAVRGTKGINIAKADDFTKACLEEHMAIRQGDWYEHFRWGSASKEIYARNMAGSKFIPGNWEAADIIKDGFGGNFGSPEEADEYWRKQALYQEGCFGCPMHHKFVFDIRGKDIGTAECVDWLSFGGPVWNNKREVVIEAVSLCNKYGLDTVSTANSISFLMELHHRGIITEIDTDGIPMKRGSPEAIMSAIHKIASQEGFGKLFRNGVLGAARQIGKGAEDYAMHVKGLELYQEEPRAYRSIALHAAVGKIQDFSVADLEWAKTEGATEALAIELFGRKDAAVPNTYKDKALSAWDMENRHLVTDLLGVCKFLIPWGPTVSLEVPAKLFALATGVDTSEEELLTAAQRVRTLERAFDATRGFSRKDDMLPKRMFETPVSYGPFKGEVLDREQFDSMLSEYDELRGYDEDGIPKEETFNKFGLSSELEVFKERLSKGSADQLASKERKRVEKTASAQ